MIIKVIIYRIISYCSPDSFNGIFLFFNCYCIFPCVLEGVASEDSSSGLIQPLLFSVNKHTKTKHIKNCMKTCTNSPFLFVLNLKTVIKLLLIKIKHLFLNLKVFCILMILLHLVLHIFHFSKEIYAFIL